MKGFSFMSNTFTYLSTPIGDSILLNSNELYSILFDNNEVSI